MLYLQERRASIALWTWTLNALHRHNFRRLIPLSHLLLRSHLNDSITHVTTVFYWSYHTILKSDSISVPFLCILHYLLLSLLLIAKRMVKSPTQTLELTLLMPRQVKAACWTKSWPANSPPNRASSCCFWPSIIQFSSFLHQRPCNSSRRSLGLKSRITYHVC